MQCNQIFWGVRYLVFCLWMECVVSSPVFTNPNVFKSLVSLNHSTWLLIVGTGVRGGSRRQASGVGVGSWESRVESRESRVGSPCRELGVGSGSRESAVRVRSRESGVGVGSWEFGFWVWVWVWFWDWVCVWVWILGLDFGFWILGFFFDVFLKKIKFGNSCSSPWLLVDA